MRKKYKHLEALFGGKVPDVRTFNQSLSEMPAAEREHVVNRIISLGFTAWTELSPKHKDFIVAVIEHERQPIVDFCTEKTVLGRLRYTLRVPKLFIAMFHLLEAVCRTRKTSLNHLAMVILISFHIRLKVSSLGNYLADQVLDTDEVMVLLGKAKVTDVYNVRGEYSKKQMNINDFLENNCTFSLLESELLHTCKPFACGNDDLDDFFINNSALYSAQLLGKTYCFRLDKDLSTIVCAFAVANDSIKVNFLPNSRKKKVTQDIPYPKQHRSYPAVLIGRLGVNKEFQGHHIGEELLNFIKDWFVSTENKTGCRFIVVDAYNEKQVIHFYEKNEFHCLFSTEQQERDYLTLSENSPLLTRLMIFDLINIL